ncbi:MAG TPA: anhydro-N-acetylmuramic acid kinase [Nitrosomonas sp.]|nr:anhydro-N-acetylmuramic acid kinase [Nitrosomonas sp.]HQX12637.1 anhydro-N-acetylmuramic acid kinase [Nitrosomonas sp.]HRB21007.1 anhydro-N-acetylmuramic acid kinase [Nitrosomonas sp.]HRB32245.1 anhydro-N-acetylmuramic acid kinase [Nitrosomonas sp.]HRB44907.1 anhydro-N-acetylmuramic acid kinase [Nitrosomonas sp.]
MKPDYYIGLMSGTSLDGIDAVLVDFSQPKPVLIEAVFQPYDSNLRTQLLKLHHADFDELNRAALLGNELSSRYADAVLALLTKSTINAQEITAIGCHGQTIRHCPEKEKRYTIQLVNASLLAELTDITVVADFRSRDIAAGGQGAPLVPAFHHALFSDDSKHRVIVNIGGIANITSLDPKGSVIGFDCGPGNMLMDEWCLRHTGKNYDAQGEWAKKGTVIHSLLAAMMNEDFFSCTPPKSTGRDLFNRQWLERKLSHYAHEPAENVQATLLQLTATTIASAIEDYCSTASEIYVCGGGAHNTQLINQLSNILSDRSVTSTKELGVDADWVEAFAFAWLAQQTILRKPGNLCAVTGAQGERVLGAIYPA